MFARRQNCRNGFSRISVAVIIGESCATREVFECQGSALARCCSTKSTFWLDRMNPVL